MKQLAGIRTGGESGKRTAHPPVPIPACKIKVVPPRPLSLDAEQAMIRERLSRLEVALIKIAALLVDDRSFAPIFTRLEHEISLARAALSDDLLARARAVLGQNEIGASSAETCDSSAPFP